MFVIDVHMVLIDEHVFVIIMHRMEIRQTDEDALAEQLLGIGLLSNFVHLPILLDDHYFMIPAS